VWCRSQNFILEGVRFALVCLGSGEGDCQTLVLEWGYERKEKDMSQVLCSSCDSSHDREDCPLYDFLN
jgi:hypothetical protein